MNALDSRPACCSTQIGPRTSQNPYNTDAHGPAQSEACNCLRWRDRREGFVRGSGRCPQPADWPKTRLRLGKCVKIQSESWWEAAYGVCPGTVGFAGISVRRVARYSSQQGRESLEREIWNNAKKRTRFWLRHFGGSTNRKLNSLTGFRTMLPCTTPFPHVKRYPFLVAIRLEQKSCHTF